MRKSRYGPLRCDRCEGEISRAQMRVLHLTQMATTAICLGCLTPLDLTRQMVRKFGTRCLFCGAQLPLPDLMEHFNRDHGRVLVNW